MIYTSPWGLSTWGLAAQGGEEMPVPYCDRSEADALLKELFLTEDRQVWIESTNEDRDTSLSQSTRDIDSLDYAGHRNDAAQPREFPRGVDTITPSEILEACVLIAVARLDGKRPEEEIDNQSLTTVSYASVRSTYDRGGVPEHMSAGIVSFEAWRLLRPFLRETGTFQLSKV